MPCGSRGSNGNGGSSKNVSVWISGCVFTGGAQTVNDLFFFFFFVTYNVLRSGVLSEREKSTCVQNGDLKIVWPEFRTMCYLLQIYSDMIGPVVIITWEHLVLFSLNHCNGKQEPFQRTVGAILLLDSISVSLWLLDNSIFGKAGGKMCDVNSP